MKLHYKGKYNLDPESLPGREHAPGAVKFKEAEDSKKLAVIANGLSLVLTLLFGIPLFLRWGEVTENIWEVLAACLAANLIIFPHELLHAICFKEDVYLYTNRAQGMLFVVGPEDMSKKRFIFMSLLPNIIFGAVPYLIGFIFPDMEFCLVFGLLCIGMGAGDYYNVFNAITQMPKGAKTYLHKFSSYWYLPETSEKRVRSVGKVRCKDK